jgi:peptidylprolyl isomerase
MSTPTAAKRRGQAVAGGLAGLAIVVVLAVVFFAVRAGDDGDDQPAAAAPAPAAATQAPPSEQAPVPQPTEPAAPAVETPPALAKEPDVKPGKGKLTKLVATALVPGTGPAVKAGQTITANYKLVSYTTGKVIDSSWQRGEPFSTPIGTGAVIQGWDQGIPGQKVGSRVQLDVPAALAYGAQQGDLRFVVDILAAQ